MPWGKKLLFQIGASWPHLCSQGLARELLPAQPNRPQPQPWWLVSVVNISKVDMCNQN